MIGDEQSRLIIEYVFQKILDDDYLKQ